MKSQQPKALQTLSLKIFKTNVLFIKRGKYGYRTFYYNIASSKIKICQNISIIGLKSYIMVERAIFNYYKFFDETIQSSTFIVLMISTLIFMI